MCSDLAPVYRRWVNDMRIATTLAIIADVGCRLPLRTRLVLDYGFTMLGLHHIWPEYVAFNHAARRVHEKAGFKEAGMLSESWQYGGRQHDVVLMDILSSEFESPVLRGLIRLSG